ncbi:MAG TPA: phosphatase PAP2 family protein [Opitutaceae bacterium]|nr:phosphatase PAP2 family protein [Opitutaceae bacterium]
MPSPRSSLRSLLLLFVCLVLIVCSIAYVDRAAATFSYEHLHRPAAAVWLTHLVDPLQPLAILGLAGSGLAALVGGWRPGERGRTLLALCAAILIAVATKEELKYLFGRTWPETWVANNPSWIRDHVFGFTFLHGGQGWASFPSGHTTQMSAVAGVVWVAAPRWRWLGVLLVALVTLGLWAADFHFVGDILAGATLGGSCGVGTHALICRRRAS